MNTALTNWRLLVRIVHPVCARADLDARRLATPHIIVVVIVVHTHVYSHLVRRITVAGSVSKHAVISR